MLPLTKRQREILTAMAAADPHGDSGELVYEEGAGAYLDLDPVAPRTVLALLRVCAITPESAGETLERYRINQTGRELLEDEAGTLAKLGAMGL